MSGSFGYLDVCSGLSAPTLAWKHLGWRALCYSEIDAAPRAVLRHHYPDTPLHGDFTKLRGDEHGPADLLVGGTPCQDYSVAGLRAGLDGDRGNLTLEFSRLAYRARARWMVWENVPGVFSSNNGRDFGAILATFSGRHGLVFAPPRGGWNNSGIVEPVDDQSFGLAWRVLDAQFFGVPQRRRRVFLVGHIGSWQRAAAVLLDGAGLSGNPPPRRTPGQGVAPCLEAGANRTGGERPPGTTVDTAESLIATYDRQSIGEYGQAPIASTDSARDYKSASDLISHSLRAEGFDAGEDGTGRGTPIVPVHCFDARQQDVCQSGSVAAALDTDAFSQAVMLTHGVRRLTPRECERLQGIPDDFTLVPYRKGLMADGPRYRMIGNSWAVPCGRWLGERIQFVESLL